LKKTGFFKTLFLLKIFKQEIFDGLRRIRQQFTGYFNLNFQKRRRRGVIFFLLFFVYVFPEFFSIFLKGEVLFLHKSFEQEIFDGSRKIRQQLKGYFDVIFFKKGAFVT